MRISSTQQLGSGLVRLATCKRGSVLFGYEPIKQIINICINGQKNKLWPMQCEDEIRGKRVDGQGLDEACHADLATRKLCIAIEMMIYHLPSPAKAQKVSCGELVRRRTFRRSVCECYQELRP